MQRPSLLDAEAARYRKVIPAGDYWIDVVKSGQIFRIVDVEGNQAADTLLFSAADPGERYSIVDTMREQRNVYLGVGSKLLVHRRQYARGDRRRYRGPSRHARGRLRRRIEHRALCARQADHAFLPRQLLAGLGRA